MERRMSYTHHEVEIIKSMFNAGFSSSAIAKRLKRSVSAIVNKCTYLNLRSRKPRLIADEPWTDFEDETLIEISENPLAMVRITDILKKPAKECIQRLMALRGCAA